MLKRCDIGGESESYINEQYNNLTLVVQSPAANQSKHHNHIQPKSRNVQVYSHIKNNVNS